MKDQNPGAIRDYRSREDKKKDILFKEIVASTSPVEWEEKKPKEWRSFPIRNQNGSGSCVAMTMAKLLGILEWQRGGEFVEFSASDIYQRRSNKNWGDGQGMIGTDAFDIARKYGATLEQFMPSMNLTEKQINEVPRKEYHERIGSAFTIDNYVQFTPKTSFEEIASTIQKTEKGVMVWFKFDYKEWSDIPEVIVTNPRLHHSVTAVDFTLLDGKKYLVIEDSWGEKRGKEGRRLISEDFFRQRNTFCAYPLSFKLNPIITDQKVRVIHKFKKDMEFGERSEEVKLMQQVLQQKGFFPKNVDCTGYYGALTARAVLAFQKEYDVAPETVLNRYKGHYAHKATRAYLNK
jgi:hypothetical protein